MATAQTTALAVERREPAGSRAVRRLRRDGSVPGVVYGGGDEPIAFHVDARVLRNALAHAGAVLELSIGGDAATPVVVKEIARHPVTGATIHIDMLRVRLDVAISSTVVLDLVGAEDSPGVKEGGVLEQVTRELTIEALPTDIPDSIHHDVSERCRSATRSRSTQSRRPAGVTLLDDPETVIATLSPPRLQLEEEPGIEEETELVAEGETAEEAEAEAGDEAATRAKAGTRASSPSAPVPRVAGRGTCRLADRRPRESGRRVRRHPSQHRVRGRRRAREEVVAAEGEVEVSRACVTEGRTGPGGPRVAILKPMTYMNEAGDSVSPARGAYKVDDLDHVLVIHDEIDLPFGEITGPHRRRSRRPQRAEVAAERDSARPTSPASGSASGVRRPPIPIASRHTSSAASASRKRTSRR